MRIEIQIDRRAVDDLGNLVVLVIVVEDIGVQRQRAIQQRVLRAQFERVDEFRLEGQRMDREGRYRSAWKVSSTAPGGFAPPAL